MKSISGLIDMEAKDFRIIFGQEPDMNDEIIIPLFGTGTVVGLNTNYENSNQTWVMVKWSDGRTTQFEYIVR